MTVTLVKSTTGRLGEVLDALGTSGLELARRLIEHPDWTNDQKIENAVRYVRRWRSGRLPEIERAVMIADCLQITLGQLVGTEPLPANRIAMGEAVKASEALKSIRGGSLPPGPAHPPPIGGLGRPGRSKKAAG